MIIEYLNSISADDRKALEGVAELVVQLPPEEVLAMYCTSTGMAHHDVEMAVKLHIAQGNKIFRKLFPELTRHEPLDQDAAGTI